MGRPAPVKVDGNIIIDKNILDLVKSEVEIMQYALIGI
jgi:hypothetical protein